MPPEVLAGAINSVNNNTSPSRVWYVVPKHSARTLVGEVDFVSGPEPRGGASRRLLTNLGVFVYEQRWRAESLHAGVTAEDVDANTGFTVDCSQASTTEPLSADEIAAIEAIDPDDLRGLEAAPDLARMGELIAAERARLRG